MEKKYNVNVAKSRLSVGHVDNDQQFLSLWENEKTFDKVNKNLSGKPFVLLDGPPYANGQAHLGHALNKMFKDLVVKSRWVMGQPVHYRPGWDCHGLPLELAVEKKYGKLDTPTLKTRCKQLAFRSLVKQRKSFKRLGVLGQWDTPYVTLSKDMVQSSWASLRVLAEKKLLEYKQYPVHYCPACASSLAEAELENKVMSKDSLYFKMPVHATKYDNLHAVVWTTTPWTLPMNQALAFHNEHTYQVWSNAKEHVVFENSNEVSLLEVLNKEGYSFVAEHKGNELGFSTASSPLTNHVVPVLHADFVEEGRTGFVHVATAHGAEDFELGKQNGLTPVSYLNKFGVFEVVHEHLNFLNGKKYLQVQQLVCDYLNSNNLFLHYSQDNVEQQVCWRHKCGVYYNATWQAFLKLEDPTHHLKNEVAKHLEDSSLSKHYKDRLSQMLLSRSHWCLSRQRKWGTPMNLLVDKSTKQVDDLTVNYLDYLANGMEDKAQQLLLDNQHLDVFEDVLDVWFDSGNVVNHYAQHNDFDKEQGYVVDLALEGKDQFRGWFQSMLWLSVAVNNTMPYKNLFCHGFVLDELRQKFSKSAGNGSLVDTYAQQHGSDVLHLWVANQEPELDCVFSDNKLEEMKKYYSRLRLALRFTSSNLYDYDYSKHNANLEHFSQNADWDVHRFVLKQLHSVYQEVTEYFEKYQFKKALETLYLFADKTLSNFYFDWAKNPLYLYAKNSEQRLGTQVALFELMNGLFDLVKVFAPFVAEEFYQDYFNNKQSVLEASYFTKDKQEWLENMHNNVSWQQVLETRKLVQATLEPLQKSQAVKARTEVNAYVHCPQEAYDNLMLVSKLYRLGEFLAVSNAFVKTSEEFTVDLEQLKSNESYQKCPRCWNYELVSSFKHELCTHCDHAEHSH